ncbi:bile acid:sodium symporter family protein [Leptobacterium sp. I13]|uniref:bile acid:sodium symporter family protein n=1 Tax=Leptobacterium meishanense TaxID=3128904 RepID=UPI0030EF96CE
MSGVDDIILNFNPKSIMILNIILGIVMFGVSLDLTLEDFRRVIRSPKGPLIGLGAQFILLPAFTYLLIVLIKPAPSIAMGMILVSSCPGGNMSNFFTNYAKGNTALSVSMTSVSTVIAIFMTPFNISFWGSLNEHTSRVLSDVNLNGADMLLTIFMILGVPLALGMVVSTKKSVIANKLKKPFKYASLLFFLGFIVAAFSANIQNFLTYIKYVMVVVAIHNLVALSLGYFSAKLGSLPVKDRRAISFEVGIQNSGLGLLLIFDFFNGMGGMALVTAWWGIWHIVAGLVVGTYWSTRKKTMNETTVG